MHRPKREIIEKLLGEFKYWFDHVRYEPLYNGLESSFENIRKQEIDPLLDELPDELKKKINKATRRLTDKLLQIKIKTSHKCKRETM